MTSCLQHLPPCHLPSAISCRLLLRPPLKDSSSLLRTSALRPGHAVLLLQHNTWGWGWGANTRRVSSFCQFLHYSQTRSTLSLSWFPFLGCSEREGGWELSGPISRRDSLVFCDFNMLCVFRKFYPLSNGERALCSLNCTFETSYTQIFLLR